MKGAVRMSVETLEPPAMDPKLLTEVERQDTVLSELPEDYEFPLFDGRQAIESQRKSAYKNTARAAREIIDNAHEAGAKNVWVVLKRPSEQERAKHERRGTGSLPASVDIVLEMHPFRADDPYERRRWLLAHSRHEETPRRLLIEWTPDGADYRVLADAPDEDFDRGWSAIRLVLSA